MVLMAFCGEPTNQCDSLIAVRIIMFHMSIRAHEAEAHRARPRTCCRSM